MEPTKQVNCYCCDALCQDRHQSGCANVCYSCDVLIEKAHNFPHSGLCYWAHATYKDKLDKIKAEIAATRTKCYCCGESCQKITRPGVEVASVCKSCDALVADIGAPIMSVSSSIGHWWALNAYKCQLDKIKSQVEAAKMSEQAKCYCCNDVMPKDEVKSGGYPIDGQGACVNVCVICGDKAWIKTYSRLLGRNAAWSLSSHKDQLDEVKAEVAAAKPKETSACYCCDKPVEDKTSGNVNHVNVCEVCSPLVAKELGWGHYKLYGNDTCSWNIAGREAVLGTVKSQMQTLFKCACCDTPCHYGDQILKPGHELVAICKDCDVKLCAKMGEDFDPDGKDTCWDGDEFEDEIKKLRKALMGRNKKGSKTMPYDKEGNEMTFVDMVKKDGVDAAYRVAANQMTKAVKAGLATALKDKGVEGSKIAAFTDILNSDIGEALIAGVLGYGLLMVPQLKDDDRVKHLSEEFRVNGIATAGNALADTVLPRLIPIFNDSIKNLPPVGEMIGVTKPAKKRVVLKEANTETTPPVVEEVPSTPEPSKKASVATEGTTAASV